MYMSSCAILYSSGSHTRNINLCQSGGWDPIWRTGLIVGVTALAVIISLLVFLVLRSRSYAVIYLNQQKVQSPSHTFPSRGRIFVSASRDQDR
jgi:hypothetical protein